MFNRPLMLMAGAALSLMAVPASAMHPTPERRREPDAEPHQWRGRAYKKSGGKKRHYGQYKGSKRAKRATRRGGNHARA